MSVNNGIATNENTAIIMAAESGYAHDGYKMSNYKVFCSYKHVGFVLRCVRELYFRISFLPQTPWFDKRILSFNPKYIIVRDAIITKNYLKWLQKKFPDAQINFMYENMVGKARHIKPHEVPEDIRVWTYDRYDSIKYNIRLKKTMPYFTNFIVPKGKTRYDVLFVGRDKGRGDWLNSFDKFLQEKGYKTKFVITADSILSRKKPYYQKEVPYKQIADWIAHTKCIINVAMENQQGITIRDLECLFNRVKLITTNKHIMDVDLFNPNNVFILNHNNWMDVPMFLDMEYDNNNFKMHFDSVQTMIKEITESA